VNASRAAWRGGLLIAALVVAAGAASMLTTTWLITRTEAYAVAERTIVAMPSLRSVVGPITKVRSSWLEHSSVEELNVNGRVRGSAEFTLIVEGKMGSASVPVTMARNEQGWRVTAAQVERE
jgi:hypothetical protein